MIYYDETDDHVLNLECVTEELSDAQLAAYRKADEECCKIQEKLKEAVESSGGEVVFSGEMFSAYHFMGPVPVLESIATPLSEFKKSKAGTPMKKISKKISATSTIKNKRFTPETKKIEKKTVTFEDNVIDEDSDYTPTPSKRIKIKDETKKFGGKTKAASTVRPTESTSIGGLIVGQEMKFPDHTKDNGISTVDSKEISFNKLQGKTFPSLVVVARPLLQVKENSNADRSQLDATIKSVLMSAPAKFTEWLIQQGLIRSEQACEIHSNSNLKLGMYSDITKFAFSGGYVWISDCCPTRFTSVFNGSIFEKCIHPPSVVLKLIYHWSCQTNVQNVVQWVKIDNVFIKGLYTLLRSVCTIALQQNMALLGGPGKKIEVGIISLGTTAQDGQQRQVKVEVLGVLDVQNKLIRLRAIEPLLDGERNYKKRFTRILEPLPEWVQKDSIILTDLTVDRSTLNNMGYRNVIHAAPTDIKNRNSNATIMDYLRRIVPRMFQNTLSLLSRQIIQQFLDELVWRESYGSSAELAFQNIVKDLAIQTRLYTEETLSVRLNKVATNPFKDWKYLSDTSNSTIKRKKTKRESAVTETVTSVTVAPCITAKIKEPTIPKNKNFEGATSKTSSPRITIKKGPPPAAAVDKSSQPVKKTSAEKTEHKLDTVVLESYYYGVYEDNTIKYNAIEVDFNVKCLECSAVCTKNIDLQDHIYNHIIKKKDSTAFLYRCRYCIQIKSTQRLLEKHILQKHSLITKNPDGTNLHCLICDHRMTTSSLLFAHMQQKHTTCELPYNCPSCEFRCSSHHLTIDHFYEKHDKSGSLLCPFCLKIFNVFSNDEMNRDNIQSYMMHLKQHQRIHKKCSRCSLSFLSEGHRKVHSNFQHQSFDKKIGPMTTASTLMKKPKAKTTYRKDIGAFKVMENTENILIDCPNGYMCLECDADFEEDNHIGNLLKCQKCNYKTYCLPSMMDHISTCPILNVNQKALDDELYCICGFSSNIGNMIARHLSLCKMSTAYISHEIALENSVKKNMLDLLGLVRRENENDLFESSEQTDKPNFDGVRNSQDILAENIQDADDNHPEECGSQLNLSPTDNEKNITETLDDYQEQYVYELNLDLIGNDNT